MGDCRPLSSFDELLSMTVLTASWWMLLMADLLLMLLSSSSVRYCWMLGLKRPIRDRCRSGLSSGGLWQSRGQGCCGSWHAMANCWDISSLCWRTAVPEPLDAIRRHLPFQDSQWQFSALMFLPIGAGSS